MRRFVADRRRFAVGLSVLVVLTLPVLASAQASYHPALDPRHFPVPTSLVPNIEFWRAIFSNYESTQTVIHDDLYLDIVYGVVDVSDVERSGASAATVERTKTRRVREAVRRYQSVLQRLGGDRSVEADGAEVERVRALFARSARGASDYRAARNRVRGQGGLKDRFGEAIEISGMFMPGIGQILAQHDVPLEVSRMPFVESMFNYRARSNAGASGVWQFTRATGRMYLQIDSAVDARSDVLLAAEGAAMMLADNYRRVGSWPLALTAYNHGISGMVRAVRQLGTRDIGVISEKYRSRTFGFASRNFYSEFVAAVVVYADRAQIFLGIRPLPELRFDEFVPGRFVSMLDLAHLTDTDVGELIELNPALHEDVGRGTLLVPATYRLRVPDGRSQEFQQAFARLPEERKRDRQLTIVYRVRRGDTLGAVARRFGTSISALQRANQLPRADRIYIGQQLEIPGTAGGWDPLVWTPDDLDASTAGASGPDRQRPATHLVRRGQTLTQIARRYGTTVSRLMQANSLRSSLIKIGQVLELPAD